MVCSTSQRLAEKTMALARKIAQRPPVATRPIKTQTDKWLEIDINTALELAADGEALIPETNDHIVAVSNWLQKRQAEFTGK